MAENDSPRPSYWSRFITVDPDVDPFAGAVTADGDILPDFCQGTMVANVVILAEFFAIVATILSRPISDSILGDLLLISIFVQWIALASIALLCWSRKWLNRLPPAKAILNAYLILLMVTASTSEMALWVLYFMGRMSVPHPEWYAYFHVQNLTVSAIVNALSLRYFVARHRLRRVTLLEAKARMEIQKYRIRPHFLFNSMNIIASLTHRSPGKAEAAIEDMADLFRLMLDDTKNLVSINSEVEVAKKYLQLEGLRLDNRLKVDWRLERVPRIAKMPVLMLQLVLENAIYHGIEPLPEGGEIRVDMNVDEDRLTLVVSNPVPLQDFDKEQATHSAALENIRTRLQDYYGDLGSLSTTMDGDRFVITISHPAFGATE